MPLHDAADRLAGMHLEGVYLDGLANAIVSGRVALKGFVRFAVPANSAPCPIEGNQIERPTVSEILQDRLSFKTQHRTKKFHLEGCSDFSDVEVDWTELEVFARDLLAPSTPVRPVSKAELERAFLALIDRHKAAGSIPSHQEQLAELRRECPRVSERRVRAMRSALLESGQMPQEWGNPGRRPGR